MLLFLIRSFFLAYTKKKGILFMKKLLIGAICLLVICRLVFPYTRFAYFKKPEIALNGKHLNIKSAEMKTGEHISLYLTTVPRHANYSSSDFRIASVTSSGKVYALQPGTAIIYVKQGTKTYRCKIKVIR